jgi:hypothetical protein
MPKTCFVIGPIGKPDSEIRRHADDLIKYIIAPTVEQLGYNNPERADKMPDPGALRRKLFGS